MGNAREVGIVIVARSRCIISSPGEWQPENCILDLLRVLPQSNEKRAPKSGSPFFTFLISIDPFLTVFGISVGFRR